MSQPSNLVVAGLGGQGVLTATDIIADVALRAGFVVKKSEIKGMSQRGGSVICEVRFGERIFSPMVPVGEADFLVVLEPTQLAPNRHLLRPGGPPPSPSPLPSREARGPGRGEGSCGVVIDASAIDESKLPNKKMLNVALLGALSAHLDLAEADWLAAIHDAFDEKFFAANRDAFLLGRNNGKS